MLFFCFLLWYSVSRKIAITMPNAGHAENTHTLLNAVLDGNNNQIGCAFIVTAVYLETLPGMSFMMPKHQSYTHIYTYTIAYSIDRSHIVYNKIIVGIDQKRRVCGWWMRILSSLRSSIIWKHPVAPYGSLPPHWVRFGND